jgi:hypothetical protein
MFQEILKHPQFKKLPPNLRFIITIILVIILLLLAPYVPLRFNSPPSLMPASLPVPQKAPSKSIKRVQQSPSEAVRPTDSTSVEDRTGESSSPSGLTDPQPNVDKGYPNRADDRRPSALDELQNELEN